MGRHAGAVGVSMAAMTVRRHAPRSRPARRRASIAVAAALAATVAAALAPTGSASVAPAH